MMSRAHFLRQGLPNADNSIFITSLYKKRAKGAFWCIFLINPNPSLRLNFFMKFPSQKRTFML